MNKAIDNIPRIFAVPQVAYAGNGVPAICVTAVPMDGIAGSLETQAGSTPARHSRVQNKSLDGCGYGTLGRSDSCRRTKTPPKDQRRVISTRLSQSRQHGKTCSGYGAMGRFDSCRRTQALVNLRGIANPYLGNKHEARQSRKRGIPAAVMVHWAGSIPATAQITTKTQRI